MSLVVGLEEGFNPLSDHSSEESVKIVAPPPPPGSEVEDDSGPEDIAAPDPAPGEAVATPPVPPIKEDAPPDRWVKHFEKLSAKDIAQRHKDKEQDARAAELAEATKLMDLRKKGNSLEVLKQLGISVDDVLKQHLDGGKPDIGAEIASLRAEIAELKGTTSEVRKKTTDTEAAHLYDLGNRWDRDLTALLNQDNYKFIKNIPGKVDQIIDGVLRYHDQTKKLLPAQEALDIVVKDLRDNYETLHKHMSPQSVPAPTTPATKTSGPKTLSPKMNAMPRYSYPTDAQEEFAELIAKHTRR